MRNRHPLPALAKPSKSPRTYVVTPPTKEGLTSRQLIPTRIEAPDPFDPRSAFSPPSAVLIGVCPRALTRFNIDLGLIPVRSLQSMKLFQQAFLTSHNVCDGQMLNQLHAVLTSHIRQVPGWIP